ncbi:hypothetical protein D9757_003205 [Collybiopsis confluens]|uniref:Uncharacterized protein n=1 Tax=Collybiopsis confluens TaxID=2823264 RepID=A0A8H5HZ68_9AGAR|nr:hypothetical protein D9757_003205 [Collybiopsis confluens]
MQISAFSSSSPFFLKFYPVLLLASLAFAGPVSIPTNSTSIQLSSRQLGSSTITPKVSFLPESGSKLLSSSDKQGVEIRAIVEQMLTHLQTVTNGAPIAPLKPEKHILNQANYKEGSHTKTTRFTVDFPGSWPKAPSVVKKFSKKFVTLKGTFMVRDDLVERERKDSWNLYNGYMTDGDAKTLIFRVVAGKVVGETNVPFDTSKDYLVDHKGKGFRLRDRAKFKWYMLLKIETYNTQRRELSASFSLVPTVPSGFSICLRKRQARQAQANKPTYIIIRTRERLVKRLFGLHLENIHALSGQIDAKGKGDPERTPSRIFDALTYLKRLHHVCILPNSSMATPTQPTFYCSQQSPNLSNIFLKDVYQLYRQNAQAVSLDVELGNLIELQMTTITVTNSLIFAGSMRMQGKIRNILNAECFEMSFHESMTCVAASSSQFVLEKLYPLFSWHCFLSLAGKPNCDLSDSLLEKVCRGLVVGTGELYEKHKDSSIVGCDEASTSSPTSLDQTSEILPKPSPTTPAKAEVPIEPHSCDERKTSNSSSIKAESIVAGYPSITKPDEPLRPIDGPSKSPFGSFSKAAKYGNLRQRRTSALLDENTPPRNTSATDATRRRFVSMPLQSLPSDSRSVDEKLFLAVPDANGSHLNALSPRKRAFNGVALSPLPRLDFCQHDQASGRDIGTANSGASRSSDSNGQAHSLKSSRSLIVIARDANTRYLASGSSLHETVLVNKTQPRQRRTSTPETFNRPSPSSIKAVANGNVPFISASLDIPRPRQRRTSTPATFGPLSSASVKSQFLNEPSPRQRRTSTPAALNVSSSSPRRRSASVTLSLQRKL